MEKNQRNQRKRLNSLILLVAFTAVMLIVSTYAWFVAQKNVTLGNLQGTVTVVEGLEVSLDAKTWGQEIDFSDVVYGADQSGLKKQYGSTEHNIIPSEMTPISTTGDDGIGYVKADGSLDTATGKVATATELAMYKGKAEVSGGHLVLSDIQVPDGKNPEDNADAKPTDLGFKGYYAIDLFIRNSGEPDAAPEGTEEDNAKLNRLYDALQINEGSSLSLLSGGSTTTGLQNTVRVAFALYEATEVEGTASVDVLASQDEIINATVKAGGEGTSTIRDVAIWEPNAYDHIEMVTTNQRNTTVYRVLFNTTDDASTAYNIPKEDIDDSADVTNMVHKITATQLIPTYALNAASTTNIGNVYDWNDGLTTNKLKKQVTLKTNKKGDADFQMAGTAKNLVSVRSDATKVYKLGNETGAQNFYIPKNEVSRIRMYVWLEGQDVDCINQASHGGGIELDVGLVRDSEVVS